jgi:hypothetical protein
MNLSFDLKVSLFHPCPLSRLFHDHVHLFRDLFHDQNGIVYSYLKM